MLNQQTIDRLYNMKLFAMAEAFSEQMDNPQMAELSFPDRFGLIIDRQWCEKERSRPASRTSTMQNKEAWINPP
jgi:hypothetical protein